jgi:hypothetical protein
MSSKGYTLEIPFTLRGIPGSIGLSIVENTDPARVGYELFGGGATVDAARGFPICRANVRYAAEGYAAVFGWTQMVRSTDAADRFEMDPIAIYESVATPFAWYGVKPEAFDAPSRETRYEMEWEAQCFLCVAPDAVLTPRVAAVAGFSWGFVVTQSDIHFAAPRILRASDWNSHLPLLRDSYPAWTFDDGLITK